MWWETVLIAAIPSLVTMLVTNWFNKKRYSAEVKILEEENVSIKNQNSTIIFDMYKKELEDVNRRFTNYITEANEKAKLNKDRILKLESDNKLKNEKIKELEERLNALIDEVCFTKGCTERTYFKEKQLTNK